MKKPFSMLLASALAMGLLGLGSPAGALAAPSTAAAAVSVTAAKKPVPRIVVGKTTTTSAKKPYPVVSKLRTPVLHGATTKNRKLFASQTGALLAAERKSVGAKRAGYANCRVSSKINVKSVSAAVHKNRYASVAINFSSSACGGKQRQRPRSFTIDLKTGKKVGLASLMDFEETAMKRIIRSNQSLIRKPCRTTFLGDIWSPPENQGVPRANAWNLTSKGIRLWYRPGVLASAGCGSMSTLIPWREVATAGSMRGPVKAQVYVKGYRPGRIPYAGPGTGTTPGTGHAYLISTQGRKMALYQVNLGNINDYSCHSGIRGGKTATIVAYNDAKKILKLTNTSSNPGISKSSLGKFRPASASERKRLMKFFGGTDAAFLNCG